MNARRKEMAFHIFRGVHPWVLEEPMGQGGRSTLGGSCQNNVRKSILLWQVKLELSDATGKEGMVVVVVAVAAALFDALERGRPSKESRWMELLLLLLVAVGIFAPRHNHDHRPEKATSCQP